MTFSQQEIEIALNFAETVKLTAALNTQDNRTIDFHQSEELPSALNEEVKELLDIAIQYYQRSIFTGEYLMEDDSPPTRKSGEPIDDINFYLGYYKDKVIEELKKAFDLDENNKLDSEAGKPQLTPFTKVMLEYRKKMMEKHKK